MVVGTAVDCSNVKGKKQQMYILSRGVVGGKLILYCTYVSVLLMYKKLHGNLRTKETIVFLVSVYTKILNLNLHRIFLMEVLPA